MTRPGWGRRRRAEATPSSPEETKGKIAEEAPKSSIVAVEDFDSTLYWLDEAEIRGISNAITKEYQQDLRANVVAILFDIFEQREEDWARGDVLSTLEAYLPHMLSTGDFKTVASLLKETRLIVGRNQALKQDQQERLDAFVGRLSDPGVVAQILQSIDEATSPPREEDLGERVRELRPAALETVLIWLPKLLSQSACSPGIGGGAARGDQSQRSAAAPAAGRIRGPPGRDRLCGRLQLQAAVPGLGELLGHANPAFRLAAVQALAAVGVRERWVTSSAGSTTPIARCGWPRCRRWDGGDSRERCAGSSRLSWASCTGRSISPSGCGSSRPTR